MRRAFHGISFEVPCWVVLEPGDLAGPGSLGSLAFSVQEANAENFKECSLSSSQGENNLF